MPDRMPEKMPEDMPDRMTDRMPEDMPDRMPEDLPDRMPEDMPEHMPDRMPEDMSDRMPEDLPVRKCIKLYKCHGGDKYFLLWNMTISKEGNHHHYGATPQEMVKHPVCQSHVECVRPPRGFADSDWKWSDCRCHVLFSLRGTTRK
jgi:hypothetical protein